MAVSLMVSLRPPESWVQLAVQIMHGWVHKSLTCSYAGKNTGHICSQFLWIRLSGRRSCVFPWNSIYVGWSRKEESVRKHYIHSAMWNFKLNRDFLCALLARPHSYEILRNFSFTIAFFQCFPLLYIIF